MKDDGIYSRGNKKMYSLYEQFRKQKLKERREAVKNYTLEITDKLPKPNFKKTKAKISERGDLDKME